MGGESPSAGAGALLKVVRGKLGADDIPLRAAALAYSTLVSLVPILALVLVMLSGPAFEKSRERVVDKFASAMVPSETTGAAQSQANFKDTFRAEVGTLAANAAPVSFFGFLLLLVTAGMLFAEAESSFNAIWRVSIRRPFFLRVAVATSMLFWGPLMLAASLAIGEVLGGIPVLGTHLAPLAFTAAAFTSFFMLMPHARVRLACALAGGFCAALCWELAKALFVYYATNIVSYSKVYGSLGLIPMLFLWVYLNWLLILAGAELAYCMQHRGAMWAQWLARQSPSLEAVPLAIALALAVEVARRFRLPANSRQDAGATAAAPDAEAGGGIRASTLAQALHIEPALALRAAELLVRRGILARVLAREETSPHAMPTGEDGAQGDPAFLPACDPQACSVATLVGAALDDPANPGHGSSCEKARQLLKRLTQAARAEFGSLTLKDLADLTGHAEPGSS